MHLSNLKLSFGAPEMLLKEIPLLSSEANARGSRVPSSCSELISMQELKLPENLEAIMVIEDYRPHSWNLDTS